MLAIQRNPKSSEQQCTPNILPCKITHNGPVNAAKRHWAPEHRADGKTAAYFRGRELHGKIIGVPNGYKGVVVEKTDRTLPPPASRSAAHDEQDEAEDEDEEAPEDVRVVQEIASFNNITVWGHESIPSSTEDPYSKGIEEWMTFAQSIHSYDDSN